MTGSLSRNAAVLIAGIAAALAGFASPGGAQQAAPHAPPQRVIGRIAKVAGGRLTIKAAAGKMLTVALAPDASVTLAVPAKLSDIKPGRFVGTAARPEINTHRWRAIEVHIFPAGSRLGEGHRAWPPEPGATMTNADVAAVVTHTAGSALTLTTNGRSYDIDVPKGTPIVAMRPGSAKLLVKGARISIVQAVPQADGTLAAKSVTVSRDKRWPPK